MGYKFRDRAAPASSGLSLYGLPCVFPAYRNIRLAAAPPFSVIICRASCALATSISTPPESSGKGHPPHTRGLSYRRGPCVYPHSPIPFSFAAPSSASTASSRLGRLRLTTGVARCACPLTDAIRPVSPPHSQLYVTSAANAHAVRPNVANARRSSGREYLRSVGATPGSLEKEFGSAPSRRRDGPLMFGRYIFN